MKTRTLVAAAGLLVLAVSPLAARQGPAADSAAAAAAPVSSDTVAWGPRLRAEVPAVRNLGESPASAPRRAVHTFTITTLALVLLVVLVVLLIS